MQPTGAANRLELHDLLFTMETWKKNKHTTWLTQNPSLPFPHMAERDKHMEKQRQDNKKNSRDGETERDND